MKYTTLSHEEIRAAVYQEARKQFLEHGIIGTEMKSIAAAVGIGRTTLYRYFPSIEVLAFMAAAEFFRLFFDGCLNREGDEGLCGYDRLLLYYDRSIDRINAMPQELIFFQQFDSIYSLSSYSSSPEGKQYGEVLAAKAREVDGILQEGLADGSIRPDADIEHVGFTIGQVLLGFAQRTVRHEAYFRDTEIRLMHSVAHTLIEKLKAQRYSNACSAGRSHQ